MLDFKPPKPNTALIQVAKGLVPFINRLFLKGLTLDIDAESIARLKKVDGHPTVLAPNHAARADPAVMFCLSKTALSAVLLHECTRELWQRKIRCLRGFLMQRFGAYSIVRGTARPERIPHNARAPIERQLVLVIFAEGEISRQNDTVMRFERGIIQLCFWALDDMVKAEISKPLYVVPIGIKYHYPQDMWGDIDAALTELERNILHLRIERRLNVTSGYGVSVSQYSKHLQLNISIKWTRPCHLMYTSKG